jgi:hypothetical protein
VARDAITRLYDVEKNSVDLDIPKGLITFRSKKGKTVDLERLRESFQATRLSGRTGMEVSYLEVDVRGRVSSGAEPVMTASGCGQQFALVEEAGSRGGKGALQRLREALARGENVVGVTGRVAGWNGLFPDVLRALANQPSAGTRRPVRLTVTGFQTGRQR